MDGDFRKIQAIVANWTWKNEG